jgi:hypothetical protein
MEESRRRRAELQSKKNRFMPKWEKGGALLTKKVTCKNCGWKWDAADGGDDVTTCHKCGGQGLVHAQKGGSQIYTYADRPEAKYKKDAKGNWLISLPSTNGKYVPIKDPTGKRAGELNEKAKPITFKMPAIVSAEEKYKDGPLQSADWLWTLPIALPAATQAAGAVGAMSLPGMSSIPGATVGNLVNSGFIANSLFNAPENAKEWYDVSQGNKNWQDAALGSAEIAAGLYGSGAGWRSLVDDAAKLRTPRVAPIQVPVKSEKEIALERLINHAIETGALPTQPKKSFGTMIGNQADWDNYIRHFYEGTDPIYMEAAQNSHLAKGYYLPDFNLGLDKGGRSLRSNTGQTGLFGMPAENLSNFTPAKRWEIFDIPIGKNQDGGSLPKAQFGMFDKWKKKNVDQVIQDAAPVEGVQNIPEMTAYGSEAKKKLQKTLLDKANALWDTVEGRRVWMEEGPKNYSIGELKKFVSGVKEFNAEAQRYERDRRLVEKGELSTDVFAQRFKEGNWARFDENTGREQFKGQYQNAVDEANARKEQNFESLKEGALELSGFRSAQRIQDDPLGTLKGVVQTGADALMLPFAVNEGAYNYFTGNDFDMGTNPLTGTSYGEGFNEAMDVVSVLPIFAGARTVANPLVKSTVKALGTESRLLSKTNKVNPRAFKTNPNITTSLSSQGVVDDATKAAQNAIAAQREAEYAKQAAKITQEGTPQLGDLKTESIRTTPDSPISEETFAIKGLDPEKYDELVKQIGPENIKDYKNYTGVIDGEGYGSAEEVIAAQLENFDFGSDFAKNWALKDPEGFQNFAAADKAAWSKQRDAITKSSNKLVEADRITNQIQHEFYAKNNTSKDEINNILWGNSNTNSPEYQWARQMQEGADNYIANHPDLEKIKTLNQEYNTEIRAIDDAAKRLQETRANSEFGKDFEKALDPEFLKKIGKIYDQTTGGTFDPSKWRSGLIDVSEKLNSSKLVYADKLSESYQSLSASAKEYLLENIDSIGGVRLSDETITLGSKVYTEQIKKLTSEEGIDEFVRVFDEYLKDPDAIGGTAVHESGHILQDIYRWADLLKKYDPAYAYNINKDTNPLAQAFKAAMVEPTLAPKKINPATGVIDEGSEVGNYTSETWKSVVTELHSEMMKARMQKARILMQEDPSLTIKGVIAKIKKLEAKGDKDLFNFYLNEGNLNKHFKSTTPTKIKTKLLKVLPVGIGVAMVGSAMNANAGTEEQTIEGFKKGGSTGKKYSRSLEAKNQLYTESKLTKKKKPKNKKIFSPTSNYFQVGGVKAPIPAEYKESLKDFKRPTVDNGPYPGYNALNNTITQDPNSPVENVNNDWWYQHELFHQLQNDAGGMSTYGKVGQRPNPYAASDEAIHGYYDRRDADLNAQIDRMIQANPSLQFIPRERLAQNLFPDGSNEPSFVGAESLMYNDPSTVEGEARAYENYIRRGGKPLLENGGIPDLPLNKNRQVLRDWTYGESIGMLQEKHGGVHYAQAGLNLTGVRTAPVATKAEPKKEVPVKTTPVAQPNQLNLQGIRTAPPVVRTTPKKEEPKKEYVKPRPVTPQISPFAMMHQIHEMYNNKVANAKDLRPKSKEEQRRETSPLEVFTGTNDLFKSYTTADQRQETQSPLDMFGNVNDAFNEAANKRSNRVPGRQESPLDMFGFPEYGNQGYQPYEFPLAPGFSADPTRGTTGQPVENNPLAFLTNTGILGQIDHAKLARDIEREQNRPKYKNRNVEPDSWWDNTVDALGDAGEYILDTGVDAINTLGEWKNMGKRYLQKKGLIDIEEGKIDPNRAKKIQPKINQTPRVDKFYQEIAAVKDEGYSDNNLLSYRNQWDNNEGFVYIATPTLKDRTGKEEYNNVRGVGHFLLDASAVPGKEYKHEYNEAFLKKAYKNNDWIPTFTPVSGNKVRLKYKKPDEITKEDKVVTPLRQFKFDNLAFDKTQTPAGFQAGIKEVKTKDGAGSYLIFKDRNGYSRFSGGSVVFIFKDKYGNTIVRDFAGTLNNIENEGLGIKKTYGLKDGDLTIGYHDVGSFSAKPKADESGVLRSSQWGDFNPNPMTGGALLIPNQ